MPAHGRGLIGDVKVRTRPRVVMCMRETLLGTGEVDRYGLDGQ